MYLTDGNSLIESDVKSSLLAEVSQVVSFEIGSEEYALDILDVQEIIRMVEITPVPNAPYYVEGIINLRGKVLLIIDLRLSFPSQCHLPITSNCIERS